MNSPHPAVPDPAWHRPMTPRAATEPHRTSTVLELFFDLCFVTAVAQAGTAFEHELVGGHVGDGVLGYVLVYFAIWWAWMNFTWFASAYDTDDVPYRVLTFVQITGALVMAAGVSDALEHRDFTVVTWGYVVMRLTMVTQWLRAGHSDPERRRVCRRYALGILLVQIGWVARLALPAEAGLIGFAVLAVAELAVPPWAESPGMTTWHPHHIVERYGLFTIIVLGESITASTVAVRAALDTHSGLGPLLPVVVGGLLTAFALWWLYFSRTGLHRLTRLRTALLWGYGHYLVFASAAAAGAGLAVFVAHSGGRAPHLGEHAAGAAYTVPVAVFLLVTWFLHRRSAETRHPTGLLQPLGAVLVLACAFLPEPVLGTGIVTAALVAVTVALGSRRTTGNTRTQTDVGTGPGQVSGR